LQRIAAETKSKGGILIPEKGQKKGMEATVVAVGSGTRYGTAFIPVQCELGLRVVVRQRFL
jgi:chaperonin GroES